MILAQHGFAASDRVQKGIIDQTIDGVIISASNINSRNVSAYIRAVKETSGSAHIFFDSEYYVNFIEEADKFGKLASYPSYFNHPKLLTDLASPSTLQEVTKTVLSKQNKWGLDNLLTPTVVISSFGTPEEFTSLALLNSSVEYAAKYLPDKKLYGTILINENTFTDLSRLAIFLDSITRIKNLTGFYVVADRTGQARSFWDNPQNLAAYMYMINVLTKNRKRVVLGYCDGTGLLGLSVGAEYIGVGWWQNTTNFTRGKFVKRGGRRNKKYYSEQLMNSIYVDPELVSLVNKGDSAKIANSTSYDDDISVDPYKANWSDERAILHKWEAMRNIAGELDSKQDTFEKLNFLENKLKYAKKIYNEVSGDIPDGFDTTTGSSKATVWLNAISLYRDGVI